MQKEIEFPDDVSTEARTNMRARSRRVKKLLGIISDAGLDMEEHTLIARYAISNQISSDTARSYLRELIDAEYVFRCDGHILTLSDYENRIRNAGNSSNKSVN